MSAPPSSPVRSAAAVIAVVVGSLALTLLPAPARGAAPDGRPAAQDDPSPTTRPVETDVPEGTVPPGGGTDLGDLSRTEEAREEADADLRGVWTIVYALTGVAVGLLVLLVVYAWATKPARATARLRERQARADARAQARARARGEDGPFAGDGLPAEEAAEQAGDETATDGSGGDREGSDIEVPVGVAAAGAASSALRPVRARRVEAPTKHLATPDAERVLVRPGQAPIRVPNVVSDGRPPPAPSTGPPPRRPPHPSAPPVVPVALESRPALSEPVASDPDPEPEQERETGPESDAEQGSEAEQEPEPSAPPAAEDFAPDEAPAGPGDEALEDAGGAER